MRDLRPAIVMVLAALAVAAPAASAATTPSVSFPEEAAAARRFWTPARMEAAQPRLGTPPAHGSALDPALTSTSETIDDPTLPGYRVNGAIFISEGAGVGFGRCSGTSVVAPSGSVVITAGHCVYDAGIWADRKWVFVPGYKHGERPFGTF